MVGMYLGPYGNNKDQVKYIHKKVTEWATSISVGGVKQNEARKALNSATPPKMKYPLSDMTINEKEYKHTIQTIVKFGLTKAVISSNLQTEVRYGTRYLRGIGIFDPFRIQGTGRMAFLTKKYGKSTPSSPLLRANL